MTVKTYSVFGHYTNQEILDLVDKCKIDKKAPRLEDLLSQYQKINK